MRVFLDANVLFSAANVASNLHRLMHQLAHGHTLITSNYAWEEAARNLSLKRPPWQDGLAKLQEHLQIVPGVDRPVDVPLADKDRPILAGAIELQCDALVTGDKRDFGHLLAQTIQGVHIVTPLDAARLFAGGHPHGG